MASNRTVTARQYVALYLYYVQGESQRAIATTLGISRWSMRGLVERGTQIIVNAAANKPTPTYPFMRTLFAPSPTSSPSANVGLAASRREELSDALELRMEQRAAELAEIEECMSGDSFHPTHIQRNHFSHWELRYLAEHEGRSITPGAYRADRAAQYCGGDASTCNLGCAGCESQNPSPSSAKTSTTKSSSQSPRS